MTHQYRSSILILSLALLANFTSCINDPEPVPEKKLDIGSKTELGSVEVGTAARTISITSGKFNGLKVIIPENAYPSPQTVRIYAAPITGNSFGENINPRTDMFTLDAGDVFAEANITVVIPINIPAGEFAMGFYYDQNTKELEGLPINSVNESSIAVVMRKPGDFFITSIPTAKLAGKHASAFTPGIDDWDMINEGTAQTPNGQSAGMTLSALWYYHTQTAKGQPHLWGRFNSEYDDPPKLWYDNVEGIQFAAQTELAFDWHKNWKQITAGITSGLNDLTRNAIAYSILVTNKPQLVAVSGDKDRCLPLIAYKKDEDGIYFSDPIFQAKGDRIMQLMGSKPGSYSSALSTIAYKKQDFAFLRYCAYMGVGAIVDFEKIGAIKNKAITTFPSTVTIQAVSGELLKVDNNIYTFSDSVRIDCIDTASQLYLNGTLVALKGGRTVTLEDGENIVGVLLTSTVSETSLWRAWQWHSIRRESKLLLLPIKDTGFIADKLMFVTKTLTPLGSKYSVIWEAPGGQQLVVGDTLKVSYSKTGKYPIFSYLKDNITGKYIDTSAVTAEVVLFPFSVSPISTQILQGTEIEYQTQRKHKPDLHLRYEWHFGNGGILSVSDSNKIQYKHPLPGNYDVHVKVFDIATNNLYGESAKGAQVKVSTNSVNFNDILKSMKYVRVTFSGKHIYYYSVQITSYNDIDTFPITISNDTARFLNWSGEDFSANWEVWTSVSDTDRNEGSIDYSSTNKGYGITGGISTGGSRLKNIRARRWENTNSGRSGGRYPYSQNQAKEAIIEFNHIPITYLSSDSIQYHLSGQDLQHSAFQIYNKDNWDKTSAPYLWKHYEYRSTYWDDLNRQPSISILFHK